MASWPAGLPDPTAASEPVTRRKPNSIRSSTDTGPGKVRRRFTGVDKTFSFILILTKPQQDIFWPWFETTLKDGTIPFDWTDRRTGVPVRWRFAKDPDEQWVAGPVGDTWQKVTIDLESA